MCPYGRAQSMHKILITDMKDQKVEISRPWLEYSASHQNNIKDHFEIIVNQNPRRSFWIHHSQIQLASFVQVGKELNVSVTLRNGKEFTGIFPDLKMKVHTKAANQSINLDVSKIKSITFLEFLAKDRSLGKLDVVTPKYASIRWNELKKKSKKWTIDDGVKNIRVGGLAILDSYETESSEAAIDIDGYPLRSIVTKNISIKSGTSQHDLRFKDIDKIVMTGRSVEDGIEAIVTKENGDTLTGAIILRIRKSPEGKDFEFGAVYKEDMLIWNTPYGYEGISILPTREITLDN